VTEPRNEAGAEIRVGLIGYGLAGSVFHAPLVAATPGMRLATIVTSNPERVEAARAAPPAVVDKPLAATAEEGRALADEARRLGLMLTVFQNRRWDGDFLTVRRLIAEGALGEVRRFESRFERWRPQPKTGWREQGDPAEAGGTLYDLGSHLVDQALVLFGAVTHVYAELDRRRPGVQVDDDAFVALTHASGVRSHLWMSAVNPDYGLRMRVLGSEQAYVKEWMDVQEDALKRGVSPDDPDWGTESADAWGKVGWVYNWDPVPTERGRWPEFYARVDAALRDGGPPPVDPMDAVAGLAEGAVIRLS
jgi:predicted dehydrogenase